MVGRGRVVGGVEVRGLGVGIRVGRGVTTVGATDRRGTVEAGEGDTGVGAAADDAHAATSSDATSQDAPRALTLDDGMPPSSHPDDPLRNEQMGYPSPAVN
jgi:hypothetical protein